MNSLVIILNKLRYLFKFMPSTLRQSHHARIFACEQSLISKEFPGIFLEKRLTRQPFWRNTVGCQSDTYSFTKRLPGRTVSQVWNKTLKLSEIILINISFCRYMLNN